MHCPFFKSNYVSCMYVITYVGIINRKGGGEEVSTTKFKLLSEKIQAAGDEMDTRRTMNINKL